MNAAQGPDTPTRDEGGKAILSSEIPSQAEPSEIPLAELAASVLADLRAHWQRGERITAETFLAKHPTLRGVPTYAVDVVYGEFVHREGSGENPSPEEFLTRFPEYAEQLGRQFDLYKGLHTQSGNAAVESRASQRLAGTVGRHGPDVSTPVPDHIVRFEIREQLATGGFGCVYRAYDPRLGRDVALKVPHAHLTDEEHRQRFLREARAAAQLQHPNLVTVHDFGVGPEGAYIAFELIDGQSLSLVIKQRAPTPREGADLMRKVAHAAHHAHTKGVFHRDLKSANVLIDADGEPFITDFGLVRLEGDSTLTADLAILGTPAYMPPEQASGASHDADARSDVYSLGVVLYELLTGQLPFVGPPHSVLGQIMTREPPRPSSVNRRVPRDLQAICLTALEKRPADRYPSAEHLADDLDRWLRGEPIQAIAAGMGTRLIKWARRRPAVAALVIVSAIALVSVFASVLINNRLQVELKYADLLRSQRQSVQGVSLLELGDGFGLLDLLDARRTAEGIAEASGSRSWLWSGWHAVHAGRLLQVVGHDTEEVKLTRFSPDATRLVTVAGDGTVQLWDPLSGKPIGRPIPGRRVGDLPWHIVAFTPDSASVVTVSKEGVLGLYDTYNGQSRGRFFQHDPEVLSVAVSDNGELLASASSKTVRVWQIDTGKQIGEPLEVDKATVSLAFSPDNRLLAVAHFEPTVTLYDIATGRQYGPVLRHAPGGDHRIVVVAFSPDGRFLASGSRDNSARLWEVSSGQAVGEVMWHQEDLWDFAFSPDGNLLATASFDGTARLWKIPSGTEHCQPLRHGQPVTSVAFSPEGDLLATASYDGTARLWKTETGETHGWPVRHQGVVTSVSFSPDGDRLVTSSSDGSARIWSVDFGKSTTLGGSSSRVYGVAFSPDDKLLAAGTGDGTIFVWNVETGARIAETMKHPSPEVTSVAFSPDGKLLASAGGAFVQLWDTQTWHPSSKPLPSPQYATKFVTFSPAGTLLAAGDGGGVVLWNPASRLSVKQRLPPPSDVDALAFSPDGRYLASGGVDKTVTLWRINGDEAQPGHTLKLPAAVGTLAFSPDGKALATASNDTIRLWDPETGQSTTQPLRQPARVESLAFWPGKGPYLLAVAYIDGTVSLLDTITGLPCGPPLRHESFVTSVAFSHDGNLLATGSFDGTARLWKTPPLFSNLAEIEHHTHVTLGAQLTEEDGIEAIPWRHWQNLRKRPRP